MDSVIQCFYIPEGFMGIDETGFYIGQISKEKPELIKIGTNPYATWLPLYISKAKVEEIANEWFSGVKTNNDLLERLGVKENKNKVKEVGFLESLIPIWGPLKLMNYELERGGGMANATPYAVMAISDAFLVRSLVMGIGKVGWKAFTSPGAIKVAVTSGYIKEGGFLPIHVIWGTSEAELHGIGRYGFQKVYETAHRSGAYLLNAPYSSFKLPVLSMKLSTISNIKALTCVTASINAWSRGNFHLVPLIAPKLRFHNDKSDIFEIPQGTTDIPNYHYNPYKAKWELLEIINQ